MQARYLNVVLGSTIGVFAAALLVAGSARADVNGLTPQQVKLVADSTNQLAASLTVVRTVSRDNSTALPQVVGALIKQYPTLAGAVATESVRLQPQIAGTLVKVSLESAPSQTAKIVELLVRQFPANCQTVVEAALGAEPDKASEILNGASLANVNLKPYVDSALSGSTNCSASRAQVIIRHALLATGGAVLLAPQKNANSAVIGSSVPAFSPAPTFSAPPVPLPATPVEINISQGHNESPGTRNYSAP